MSDHSKRQADDRDCLSTWLLVSSNYISAVRLCQCAGYGVKHSLADPRGHSMSASSKLILAINYKAKNGSAQNITHGSDLLA